MQGQAGTERHFILKDVSLFVFLPPKNTVSESVQICEFLHISKEEIDELVRRRPQLDAKSKYLLEGKYILGESDEVMAEELSIKPASVRMALTRARQCAYQLLTKEQTPSRS